MKTLCIIRSMTAGFIILVFLGAVPVDVFSAQNLPADEMTFAEREADKVLSAGNSGKDTVKPPPGPSEKREAPADTADEPFWGIGLSAISPGMPAALKGVYRKETWGIQGEANYFYSLGMLRIDARASLRSASWYNVYGLVGITANHFNKGSHEEDPINNSLFADAGLGGELLFGRKNLFSIGIEGGLLIPFWSNQGLEQYDDTGIMLANVYCLLWL
ncbi:MAG: hypothetical protein K9K78_07635 [Spirochaetales bacterium]|nr:hypothetical protein [Spirochaetales bacterium]